MPIFFFFCTFLINILDLEGTKHFMGVETAAAQCLTIPAKINIYSAVKILLLLLLLLLYQTTRRSRE